MATAVAAGLAVAHAGPGITALRTVRTTFFPLLSGQGTCDHVALTFDDGPDPAATPQFADAGHEIGVHGWRHRYLPLRGPAATHADLARTKEIIAAAAGMEPWLFRPPYGVLSTAGLVAAGRLGLTPVLWNCCGREWARGATAQSVYQSLLGDLEGGASVLLHDSDCTAPPGSWRAALGALGLLLDECDRRGLRVGPLGKHGPHWQAPRRFPP